MHLLLLPFAVFKEKARSSRFKGIIVGNEPVSCYFGEIESQNKGIDMATSLENEIEIARKEIVADGYDMSIGEIVNLYRDEEMVISPPFQRLFRWDLGRKTKFIESILLGIPFPPIFVYQTDKGVWELIDGLQRISTILEFMGLLKVENPENAMPSVNQESEFIEREFGDGKQLMGTKYLPSLAGKKWEDSSKESGDGIGHALQLGIKRARIRVEILKRESDPTAKFELFQRLNTGGANLTPQEIRNCTAIMIDPKFNDWLRINSEFPSFVSCTELSRKQIEMQHGMELALRFFVYRNYQYAGKLDVHEYLDDSLIKLASDSKFDRIGEQSVFESTFSLIDQSLGSNAFKRFDGQKHAGKFLMSVFEVIAIGIAHNLNYVSAMEDKERLQYLVHKATELSKNEVFVFNSGAGVRGTTRLLNLLPFAKDYFAE